MKMFFLIIFALNYFALAEDRPRSNSCKSIVKKLKKIEKNQNYCNSDDECKIYHWPKDSLSCFRYANRKSNILEYQKILSENKVKCGFPIYECEAPSSEIVCINKICKEKPWYMINLKNATSIAKKCLINTKWRIRELEIVTGSIRKNSVGEKYWNLKIDQRKPAPESARFVQVHFSGLVKYLAFHKSGKFQIQKNGDCKKLK